jgi:hypothetical protein
MGVKVYESKKQSGEHHAWLLWCPTCKCPHVFDSRWEFNGDTNAPTFNPSHLVFDEPNGHHARCHSFVRNGKFEYCTDSGHSMAGQTVDIPDWDVHGWGP